MGGVGRQWLLHTMVFLCLAFSALDALEIFVTLKIGCYYPISGKKPLELSTNLCCHTLK